MRTDSGAAAAPPDIIVSVTRFLDQLRLGTVVAIRVDDYIAVQTLIRERLPHLSTAAGRIDLRYAISAILASDRQSWQTIWDLSACLESALAEPQLAISFSDASSGDTPGPIAPDDGKSRRQATLRWAIAGILTLLVTGWLLWSSLSVETPVDTHRGSSSASTAVRSTATKSELVSKPVNVRKDFGETLQPRPLVLGFADYLMILLAALVVLVGATLVVIPGRLSAQRRRAAEALRERGTVTRARLSRLAEANNVARQLAPIIAAPPPISDDALADSATILARIYGRVTTTQLDIGRTITATATDGFFRPVRADRTYARHLVVLVDIEKGQHPWLEDADHLLAGWSRLGVDLVRYDFAFDPSFVRSSEGRELSFEALARKADGEALLIISRKMTIRGLDGRDAAWLDELGAWPNCALLDPAPVAPALLPPAWQAEVERLHQLGVPRFALTGKDIRALAVKLANGAATPAGTGSALGRPPVGGTEALRCWALFASISSGGWRQLQHARARLPEIEPWFPSNRHLQVLIDWAERFNAYGSGERGDGSGLAVDPDLAEQIVLEERRREAGLPPEDRFEGRCRRLLLDQLRGDVVIDPLMQEFRHLKEMEHLLALAPTQALPIISQLSGGAWHEEALAVVNVALARDRAVPDMKKRLRDALRLVVDERGELVRLADLVARPQLRQIVLAMAFTAALPALATVLAGRLGEPARTISVYLPADVSIATADRSADAGLADKIPDNQAQTMVEVAGEGPAEQPADLLPTINRELANRHAIAELQPYFCEVGQTCDLTADAETAIRTVFTRYFDLDQDKSINLPGELDNMSCDTLSELTKLASSYALAMHRSGLDNLDLPALGFGSQVVPLLRVRAKTCRPTLER